MSNRWVNSTYLTGFSWELNGTKYAEYLAVFSLKQTTSMHLLNDIIITTIVIIVIVLELSKFLPQKISVKEI